MEGRQTMGEVCVLCIRLHEEKSFPRIGQFQLILHSLALSWEPFSEIYLPLDDPG